MQHCAEIVFQTIFHRSSIVSVVHHCIDIILVLLVLCTICFVCGVLCAKIVDLMYSFDQAHLLNQNQMIGHLHRGIVVQLKGVISKFKRYYNKKNNRWHFNRIFTGNISTTTSSTTMRTMWNNTSIMMSGKFSCDDMMKQRLKLMKSYEI